MAIYVVYPCYLYVLSTLSSKVCVSVCKPLAAYVVSWMCRWRCCWLSEQLASFVSKFGIHNIFFHFGILQKSQIDQRIIIKHYQNHLHHAHKISTIVQLENTANCSNIALIVCSLHHNLTQFPCRFISINNQTVCHTQSIRPSAENREQFSLFPGLNNVFGFHGFNIAKSYWKILHRRSSFDTFTRIYLRGEFGHPVENENQRTQDQTRWKLSVRKMICTLSHWT